MLVVILVSLVMAVVLFGIVLLLSFLDAACRMSDTRHYRKLKEAQHRRRPESVPLISASTGEAVSRHVFTSPAHHAETQQAAHRPGRDQRTQQGNVGPLRRAAESDRRNTAVV